MLFFLALFTTLVARAHAAALSRRSMSASMSLMLFVWFALVSLFFTTALRSRQGFYPAGPVV